MRTLVERVVRKEVRQETRQLLLNVKYALCKLGLVVSVMGTTGAIKMKFSAFGGKFEVD